MSMAYFLAYFEIIQGLLRLKALALPDIISAV
jgi:hypothetical protein